MSFFPVSVVHRISLRAPHLSLPPCNAYCLLGSTCVLLSGVTKVFALRFLPKLSLTLFRPFLVGVSSKGSPTVAISSPLVRRSKPV